MKRLATLPILVLLAGCGHSPPTRFFTLDAMAPSRPASSMRLAPIQLEAVHLPATVDRPEVVTQTAANRLAVNDQDHWGAPLDEMMRRVLASDLLSRLPAGTVILPDAPRPPGVRGLVVTVLQLQADAGGQVHLEGSWTLTSGQPAQAVITREVRLQADAGSGTADAQAAAMSRLLADLADQIADTLTSTGQNPTG